MSLKVLLCPTEAFLLFMQIILIQDYNDKVIHVEMYEVLT